MVSERKAGLAGYHDPATAEGRTGWRLMVRSIVAPLSAVVASLMPDALSEADVERIAALARLALTGEEKALYARQLTRILEYARQVAELETRDVPPTSSVLDEAPGPRPDAARPSLGRDTALSNAPEAASGLFKVPRVLGDA